LDVQLGAGCNGQSPPSFSLLWTWTKHCPLIISLNCEWTLEVTKPLLVNRQRTWCFFHLADHAQIMSGERLPSGSKSSLVFLGTSWTAVKFSGDAYFVEYTSASISGAKYYRNQHQQRSCQPVSGAAWHWTQE
jgi:hypothetical protein